MKHLLKLLDLSTEEIIEILNLADQLKYERKHGMEHPLLKGKTLGMIFQKASTRTRVSFETGMYLSLIHISPCRMAFPRNLRKNAIKREKCLSTWGQTSAWKKKKITKNGTMGNS